MHQRFHVVSGLFVLLMTSVGASCATTGDTSSSSQEIAGPADAGVTTTNGGGHHPGHGPPQVAIDACAALADGATCSVTFTDPSGASHTLNGTCTTGPDGTGVEACAPDHPPGPPPGGGAGSDGGCAGDPGGPGGDQGDPGGGPPPTPPAVAIAACDGASVGDACDFTITAPDGTSHDLTGTCESPPTDGDAGVATIACRPRPPTPPSH